MPDIPGDITLNVRSVAAENRHTDAIANLVEASNMVGSLIYWSNWMWRNLTETWQKSRY